MRRIDVAAPAVVAAAVAALALAAPALGDRPFTQRFSANVAGGDIAFAANTLMTCPAAAPNCLAARAGTASGAALSNNAYAMERVDVDGDATTSSSSRATLSLPPGADVLFAGLYYGARSTAGGGGSPAPSPGARATVKLMVPGAPSYLTLPGAVDDSTAIAGAYQGFLDVTAQVAAAGPGVYTVADVQSGTGNDRYAGWALVVAYVDEARPPRNLTVFDGLQSVAQGDPALTIPVSGFETPPTSPVKTDVGFVAYEGDRGGAGDRALLNGRELADAANPATNFFNSSISVDGLPVTLGNPAYDNQLGFDAIITGADGYLANGDTSATIELYTTLEQYLPGVVSFATELDPAFFEDLAVENTLPPGDDPAKVGEKLRYETTVVNDGSEPVTEVELTTESDRPLSLVDVSSPDADCAAADHGSRVECELGTLEPDEVGEVKLVVRPLKTGALVNTATVSAAGAEVASASATTRVKRGRARIELTKRSRRDAVVAGERARFEIVARTRGKLSAVDLRVCDRLPDGLSVLRAPGATVRGDRACWTIDELAPRARRRFELRARAEPVPGDDRVKNVATADALNVPGKRARAALVITPTPGIGEPTPCKTLSDALQRC